MKVEDVVTLGRLLLEPIESLALIFNYIWNTLVEQCFL